MKWIGRFGQLLRRRDRRSERDERHDRGSEANIQHRRLPLTFVCLSSRITIVTVLPPSGQQRRASRREIIMPYSTYLPEHMGSIKLSPSGPFVAGSHAELTLVYTAGTFGIDDTGMLKISWRTTSDMSEAAVRQAAGGELHHGRGEQRRQARSLVRPAQHPALGEHAS